MFRPRLALIIAAFVLFLSPRLHAQELDIPFGPRGVGIITADLSLLDVVPPPGLPEDIPDVEFSEPFMFNSIVFNSAATLPTIGSTAPIFIEILELSLKSVGPVDVGGEFYDIFAELGDSPSIGSLLARRTTNTGGVFDVGSVDVDLDFFFIHDFDPLLDFEHDQTFFLSLTSGFFEIDGPQFNHDVAFTGSSLVWSTTAIPEPSALTLLGIACLPIALRWRKRRQPL